MSCSDLCFCCTKIPSRVYVKNFYNFSRRQDSQQSNSSTSSLPPMPDSLPDLSSTGYTIPRLETPTLKRTAHLVDWEDSCSAKKLRKDGRINPILSSLSSSQRIAEKEVSKYTYMVVSISIYNNWLHVKLSLTFSISKILKHWRIHTCILNFLSKC